MAYETILVEQQGAVTLITLNRPQALNALNSQVLADLGAAFAAYDADPTQHCAVLTGSEKAFAAGADIKEMVDKEAADFFLQDFFSDWQTKVVATRKPWIAAVAGFALGVLTYRIRDIALTRSLLDGPGRFAAICVIIAVALMLPRAADVLVVCLMPALVLTCYYDGAAARAVMANPVSYHLGLISYSIYLWHPLVRDIMARAMGIAHRHGFVGHDWVFIAAMLVATWLLCWASYRLIELPGHKIIKWLQRGGRARPTPMEVTA